LTIGDGITLLIFYPFKDYFFCKFCIELSKVPKLLAIEELFYSLLSIRVWLLTLELAAFVVMLLSADPLWSFNRFIRLVFDCNFKLRLFLKTVTGDDSRNPSC
jgi:hypothetical protein